MTDLADGTALPPSPLDRALRIFGDVRAGEGARALLMFLSVFVLLVAYYIIKTVREPLILVGGGAELKAYASAVQALTLVFYVPLYGWVASRLSRRRLIVAVVLFFAGCIELFFVAGQARVPHIGFVFFVWVGIFNMTMVAQFWSFANDIYSKSEGNRLFPIIAIGMTAGAPFGAAIADYLFNRGLSPYLLMQVTAALLLVHLGLYLAVMRQPAGPAVEKAPPKALRAGGGFSLVFQSRYLLLMAGLLVLLNVVNTTGEYILSRTVVSASDAALAADPSFDQEAFVGHFYAQYLLVVSILTILIQAFLVSRIVRYVGMAGALFALPLVAFGAYGLVALGAGLGAIRWAKITENSTDYSVMNTAKQMLWLPTSREEKYKAKQAIDTFFVRAGDLLAAGVVFAGTQLGLGVRGFAGFNVAVVGLWTFLGILLYREYRRLTAVEPAKAA